MISTEGVCSRFCNGMQGALEATAPAAARDGPWSQEPAEQPRAPRRTRRRTRWKEPGYKPSLDSPPITDHCVAATSKRQAKVVGMFARLRLVCLAGWYMGASRRQLPIGVGTPDGYIIRTASAPCVATEGTGGITLANLCRFSRVMWMMGAQQKSPVSRPLARFFVTSEGTAGIT